MILKLTVLIMLLIGNSNSFSSEKENEIFDINQLDPIDLLQSEYEKNKVLLIGFAHHYNHQHYIQLSKLLERIGSDKRLKYIVLERNHDISGFYELLSVNDLDKSLDKFRFKDISAQQRSLCFHEWAYSIAKFMPVIRRINKNRSNNPILVKSVDAVPSDIDAESWPGLGKPMADGTCSKHDTATIFSISATREERTARIFDTQIFKRLGPDEKVIVLYNQNHLIDEFQLCMPHMINENEWIANISPFTWITRFYHKNPEARDKTGLVLIDESIKNGWISTFEFTKRQLRRNPPISVAVHLGHFIGVLNERGLNILEKTSNTSNHLRRSSGTALYNKTLPEVAKGIIINPLAHILYDNKPAFEYLPQYCD
jgi:hypothetical protein